MTTWCYLYKMDVILKLYVTHENTRSFSSFQPNTNTTPIIILFEKIYICFCEYYQVSTVRPSLFLEAAYASNEPQHLAAVLRFFGEFIPGFGTTSEHTTYIRALADMPSSITV